MTALGTIVRQDGLMLQVLKFSDCGYTNDDSKTQRIEEVLFVNWNGKNIKTLSLNEFFNNGNVIDILADNLPLGVCRVLVKGKDKSGREFTAKNQSSMPWVNIVDYWQDKWGLE